MPSGLKGSLSARLESFKNVPKAVMKDTLEYAKGITPIDTGNARRNTRLANNAQKIEAAYGYARKILVEGHSRQLAANAWIPAVKAFFKSRAQETFRYWGNRRR